LRRKRNTATLMTALRQNPSMILTSYLNGKTADDSENNARNLNDKLSGPHFFSLNALSVSASEN
jgi:hypothetical protein